MIEPTLQRRIRISADEREKVVLVAIIDQTFSKWISIFPARLHATYLASISVEAIDGDVRDPMILSDSKFAGQPIQVMY